MNPTEKSGGTDDKGDETSGPDRRFATTLARGLSVLRAFRTSDGPLGNQDLAERTGLPKSTVSRMTYTLSQLGYLDHLRSIEKYRLGPAVLALGNIARVNLSFLEAAQPIMQELADETGTLVAFTVRDNLSMLYAHCWRPRNVATIWLEVGRKIPIDKTASGRCFLASASELELRELRRDFETSGELTGAAFDGIVKESRRQFFSLGFMPSIGSWVETINAVAVPFRSHEASQAFVFNCGALQENLSEQRILTEVGPLLRRRIGDLESMTGQIAAR
ncbi:IclR family transcriptional regulator [Pelagibius sp. Alg239-R121]|uniref:IclR family transcriptional regulator n=1 Tax=Pelagibius sp. Alg239-R121 TaxID=2993448 RepID=UPI0024A70F45|nr:IclR family transcriptional regulator [Pelagibius sp. Alg239-R121]